MICSIINLFMSSCRMILQYFGMKIYYYVFTFLTGKMRKTLFWTNKKFVTYNKFSSQNNVRKYHPDGMKRFCNTLLNANHSQIQNKSVIIKSAESLEILQKIRQIALWDVAIIFQIFVKYKRHYNPLLNTKL